MNHSSDSNRHMAAHCDPESWISEEWLDQMRSYDGEQIDDGGPAIDLVKIQYLAETQSYRVLMLDQEQLGQESALYEPVVTIEMEDGRPFVTTVRPVCAGEWKLLGPIVDWIMFTYRIG